MKKKTNTVQVQMTFSVLNQEYILTNRQKSWRIKLISCMNENNYFLRKVLKVVNVNVDEFRDVKRNYEEQYTNVEMKPADRSTPNGKQQKMMLTRKVPRRGCHLKNSGCD